MKFVKLNASAQLPTRQSEHAAGYDLHSLHDHVIGGVEICQTGVGVKIPAGHVGLIWDRSGLAAKQGITVLAGVIDADYTGEVRVVLTCTTGTAAINAGDRIAQLVVVPCVMEGSEWGEFSIVTERGANGFGSSGK